MGDREQAALYMFPSSGQIFLFWGGQAFQFYQSAKTKKSN
jgi:hypothetical protein